ncbi:mucin-2-like [Sinocyclocheilus grahami]|uniref:mucin-2-like n=1 Tax=Sinocyclocheilus grahami TaxID=75366 RepID=UPI0007AD0FCE|nr:PREDICTED: mucin-2-like [Sinocyclocheilus grahami]
MALREATLLGIIIVFSGHIHSVFTAQNVCKTYGSGIFYTFNKTAFHLKTTCPVTLTRFSHAGVDCHIIVQRGPNGLMDRVEIIVNKVTTLVHNNTVTVEGSRISLPYNHTYQHVFHYGIYTRRQSKVLPLSVTWYSVANGVSSLWCPYEMKVPSCMGNLRFAYAMLACNHTCRSLSGTDPTCEVVDDPVEGCGCTSDTHLSNQQTCSPRPLCSCHHPGGDTPPGPVVIGGRQCSCENGQLNCPKSEDNSCISGCYCPDGLFEDHNGGCVAHENCTCEFSGRVYETGQRVETNCKICTCRGGEWSCIDEACSGVCEVFGNGQYHNFDSKWYRFDGHCQYTLVKAAGSTGQFAVKTESVPCCDESLTCSRAISVELLCVSAKM